MDLLLLALFGLAVPVVVGRGGPPPSPRSWNTRCRRSSNIMQPPSTSNVMIMQQQRWVSERVSSQTIVDARVAPG